MIATIGGNTKKGKVMALQKAVKTQSKLRMAIIGPAGSGKTYSALSIATPLAGDNRVALFDTEHGSASKYSDIFDFDTDNIIAPFHPDKFCKAVQDAVAGNYGVVIIDSMSHAWNGEGGILDIVEAFAKRMKTPNSFAAWKDATPIQNRLTEAILSANTHVIVTMRSKTEYVLGDDGRGKQVPRKVGMAPIQRENWDYEFDIVLEMDSNNNAIVTKTRCPALTGEVFSKPGKDIAAILSKWLSGGAQIDTKAEQPKQTQKPADAPQVEQPKAVAPDKERKAFHDEGVIVFTNEWDQARPHVVTRYTAKQTPDNKRTSSNDLTATELTEITKTFKSSAPSWRTWWTETKAHAAEKQPVAAAA